MPREELEEFLIRARELGWRDELDRAANTVIAEFQSRGVEALLLKGAALARRLYTEGETRSYWDVDLLVSPRNLDGAREALRALRYTRTDEVLGIDDIGVLHGEVWARQRE